MSIKRICLFAGYNGDNVIGKDVLFYLKELGRFADVYYFSDGTLASKEREKLKNIVAGAWSEKHGKYDFGSWAELIRRLGWEKINSCDELLLVNDSCLGGVFPLDYMFGEMERRGVEAWGASGNHFVMSYFVCVSKKVFSSPEFRYFFENIKAESHKSIIIKKYERGLSRLLQKYKTDVYLSKSDWQNFCRRSEREIKDEVAEVVPWYGRCFFRFSPHKINLYDENALVLLLMKFPLIKKNAFRNKCSLFAVYGGEWIARNSGYSSELIDAFCQSTGVGKRTLFLVLLSRLRLFAAGFLYEEKYKKDVKIVRIFKIPVFRRKMDYTI